MTGAVVDGGEDLGGPGAIADIEISGSGGVSVLRIEIASEPEIEVLVRKENMTDPGEVLWFLLL
jgi:hypothetical protein